MNDFRNLINFAIQGSTIDLIGKTIPNFSRTSSLWVEKQVGGELALELVGPHSPAFTDSGALYLEGNSINFVHHNSEIDRALWIKGENVSVQRDEAAIPSGRIYGDRVIFAGDFSEVEQKNRVYRDIYLPPHTDCTFSILLRHWSGEFSPSDRIQITENVVKADTITLSQLNDSPKSYQILEAQFTTTGAKNIADISRYEWEIVAVNNNTYTLEVDAAAPPNISSGELRRSRLLVDGNDIFKISTNTTNLAQNNQQIEVVIDEYGDGERPVVGDVATIIDATDVLVRIEITCFTSVILDVGAIKIEPNRYRSSFNFQFEELKSQDYSRLEYPESPLAGLKSFGLLIEVEYWRGNTTLFDTDNFKVVLVEGNLFIYVNPSRPLWGTTQIEVPQSFTLFINYNHHQGQFGIYLNQKLVGTPRNGSFVGSNSSTLALEAKDGVVAIARLVCFNNHLQDGGISLLDLATSQIKEAITTTSLIEPSSINQKLTNITLPQVLIPAATRPEAEAFIAAIETVMKTLQVDNTDGFAIDDPVSIVRYSQESSTVVGQTYVVNVDANLGLIRLDSIAGIRREDYLIKGSISTPGSASVRFPYLAIDSQIIDAVYRQEKQVQLNSATAFKAGRAFVESRNYRAISEVKVLHIDRVTQRVTLNSVENIRVGFAISQPRFETTISPANYFAKIVEEIDRVVIAHQYQNGLVLENYNPYYVRVSPLLKLAL